METKEIGIEPTPLGFVQKNVALLVPNTVVLNQCAVEIFFRICPQIFDCHKKCVKSNIFIFLVLFFTFGLCCSDNQNSE